VSTSPLSASDSSDAVTDPGPGFDPGSAYRCSPNVSLRPEPFGALVYDFVTRKLSFLKTPELVEVVKGLEHHPDAHAAIAAAGVPETQRPAYVKALSGLCDSGTIVAR